MLHEREIQGIRTKILTVKPERKTDSHVDNTKMDQDIGGGVE
jgi:hypothetical protein